MVGRIFSNDSCERSRVGSTPGKAHAGVGTAVARARAWVSGRVPRRSATQPVVKDALSRQETPRGVARIANPRRALGTVGAGRQERRCCGIPGRLSSPRRCWRPARTWPGSLRSRGFHSGDQRRARGVADWASPDKHPVADARVTVGSLHVGVGVILILGRRIAVVVASDRSAARRRRARGRRPTAHGRLRRWCKSRRIQATTQSAELRLWCTASRSLPFIRESSHVQ